MSYRDYRLKSDNRCLADLLSMPPINLQKRDVYIMPHTLNPRQKPIIACTTNKAYRIK